MHILIGAAIDWIAQNDDASIDLFEEVRYSVTVCLVADLFGKDNDDIARRVLNRRLELGFISEVR